MFGFVNSPVELQAAMVCVKKKVLNLTRFFSVNNDGDISLVMLTLRRLASLT